MINRYTNLVFAFFALLACARQTTPTGGPQDKTPPKLLRSTPANNAKNFTGKQLTFTFDEFVKLKDPKEEIIISPSPGKDLTFLAKNDRIIIDLKTPLQDSTTYNINFREGVQDITESNPAEDLRIAFSTGSIIDSMSIRGSITDALIEKIPEKITVAIYQSDTFDISKHQPIYFTKANKSGKFTLRNLKPGLYKVYAFDDKNKNLHVDSRAEQYGFLSGKLELPKIQDSIQINLVTLDTRPIHINNLRHFDKLSRLKINKYLTGFTVKDSTHTILSTFGEDQTEILFYPRKPITDSIPFTFHAFDSLDQTLDTLLYLKTTTIATVKDAFKPQLKDAAINIETLTFNATVTFNKPLSIITMDSILLRLDSLTDIPFTQHELTYDTIFNKIVLTKKLTQKTIDSLSGPVQFFMSNNTLISTDQDSSKQITKLITVLTPDETASLVLELQTTQTNFLVQLITPDYKIVRSVPNSTNITFKNLTPGDFKIRILFDTNQNGHWDPGNILKDVQPERMFYFKNADGKFTFPLRANWEVSYTFPF